jgi:hypothetical protein
MNDYVIALPLDSRADRVSYSSKLHEIELCAIIRELSLERPRKAQIPWIFFRPAVGELSYFPQAYRTTDLTSANS